MTKQVNSVWVDWIDKVKILQKAVIQNSQGQLLALKRPDNDFTRTNCWDLCGGSLNSEDIQKWKAGSGLGDDHDILIKAIKREIQEETGLQVTHVHAIHTASGFNDKKGVFILAIGYLCQVVKDHPVKLSHEHSEFQWLTKQAFLKLDFGNDGGFHAQVIKRV